MNENFFKNYSTQFLYNTKLITKFTNNLYADSLTNVNITNVPSLAFLKFMYSYNFILNNKPYSVFNFAKNIKKKYIIPNLLILNFKRSRFFPSLKKLNSDTLTTLSLGLFSSFFYKGKFFIKNKAVYLVVASFLRKILLYSSLSNLIFLIKKTPLYLNEILSTINNPVISLYKHPFRDNLINENKISNNFYFNYFIFLQNKPYGFMKSRKKGRVKRKIMKRVVSVNRITD